VQVVDTQGLFDTDLRKANQVTLIEITRALALVSAKPHAFVFVVSCARVTQEELDAFEEIKDKFGTSHLVLAFTHGEKLDDDDVTIEALMKDEKNASLKEMVETVKERYVVFSNTTDSKRKKSELKALIENIEQVSKDRPWETEDLAEMERNIKEKIAKKKRKSQMVTRKS
jgi:hypothetical protein